MFVETHWIASWFKLVNKMSYSITIYKPISQNKKGNKKPLKLSSWTSCPWWSKYALGLASNLKQMGRRQNIHRLEGKKKLASFNELTPRPKDKESTFAFGNAEQKISCIFFCNNHETFSEASRPLIECQDPQKFKLKKKSMPHPGLERHFTKFVHRERMNIRTKNNSSLQHWRNQQFLQPFHFPTTANALFASTS